MKQRIVCEGDVCRMLSDDELILNVYFVTTNSAKLEWHTSHFDRFEVQLYENEDWRTLSNKLSSGIMMKKNLTPGNTYKFRIRGLKTKDHDQPETVDDSSWGPWSSDLVVTTLSEKEQENLMSAPTLVASEVMETGDLNMITMQWNELAGALAYEIQYRLMSNPNKDDWTTASSKLKGTVMKKKNLPGAEDYIFRVRSKLQEPDSWGPWSEPSSVIATKTLAAPFANLFGANNTLRKPNGEMVNVKSLAGKIIMLYFSAHWCPPCRQFTPQLGQFYNQLKSLKKPVEVVFVSADRDPQSFMEYASSMPWLSIPYDDPKRNQIMQAYQVNGIPNLKVFAPDGTKLSDNAVGGLSVQQFEMWQRSCGL